VFPQSCHSCAIDWRLNVGVERGASHPTATEREPSIEPMTQKWVTQTSQG
jgi:hypothetical protein